MSVKVFQDNTVFVSEVLPMEEDCLVYSAARLLMQNNINEVLCLTIINVSANNTIVFISILGFEELP